MTAGHAHRTVRVTRGGRIHRALTHPLVSRVPDDPKIDSSPFVYREEGSRFVLTTLGILHALVGLELEPLPPKIQMSEEFRIDTIWGERTVAVTSIEYGPHGVTASLSDIKRYWL